jgi:diguanylate cyclase (GGDEF)-like protein
VFQTITPIRDARDEITHFVSINEDFTAQKEAAEQVRRMAYFDPLTRLPNRVLFLDRLNQGLILAKRNRDRVAVLFVDLDRFKSVNDTHGHHVGDALLQAAADRLRACVRESDTVARIAGDEFTVILPQGAQRDGAAVVAEKIVSAMAEPFVLHGHSLRIGASVGVALYPDDADDAATLIKLADAAMYAAKQESRNTWRFHKPDD